MDGELTYQAWATNCENELPKLKPCPFCGGEAEVYEMQYGADGQYSVFGVFCVDDSKAELIGLSKYQHGHFIDNYATEAEAIEAWNKRAETVTVVTGITTVTDAPQITYVQERTCRFVSSKGSDYPPVCSACGYGIIVFDMEPLHYCPNCGAKVVSE